MEYPFKDLMPLDEVLEREGYYKDWTHLDPEVFYSLTQISNFIKTKGYGVDVRLLIAQLAEHFGLKTTQVVDLGNLLIAKHAALTTQFEQAVSQVNADRNALETEFNQSVAQMQAEKDAVIANATVDSEVILARGDKPTLQARLDDAAAQLAQTKQELKTKRAHMTALSGDTKAPFEIHNQAGQDGADVSSEVTHHYTDATAKVIDNVGDGTILMLSNSQNTVMRPDKGADFVGNGNMLKYRKFNNTTKLYEEILNVDSKGNIERKAVDEPFNIIVRKANNGYPAFSIDSAVAQTIPVNFRNGGSFLTFQDEGGFTKSSIVSPANKTIGLELRAEAGSIYLQAPNGTVQIRFNGQLYQAQLVMTGTTAQRPIANLSNGRFYFDTTLGKPIWRLSTSDTGWVDATGNPA